MGATRQTIADKTLRDGDLAVVFFPGQTERDVQASVEKLIDQFAPNLLLGISDELSESPDAIGAPKREWVARRCGRC